MTYMTAVQMHDLADELAKMIIAEARNLRGPVVWITGNSHVPPLRALAAAERVYKADNNDDGMLWEAFTDLLERRLTDAGVLLDQPCDDNSLFAVDLRRWRYREDIAKSEWLHELNDEWEPVSEDSTVRG